MENYEIFPYLILKTHPPQQKRGAWNCGTRLVPSKGGIGKFHVCQMKNQTLWMAAC
jgi:hypothetical protein